jgi:hypothetical protein
LCFLRLIASLLLYCLRQHCTLSNAVHLATFRTLTIRSLYWGILFAHYIGAFYSLGVTAGIPAGNCRGKGPGFQYPAATLAASTASGVLDTLVVVYSVNKENVAVTMVPVAVLNSL